MKLSHSRWQRARAGNGTVVTVTRNQTESHSGGWLCNLLNEAAEPAEEGSSGPSDMSRVFITCIVGLVSWNDSRALVGVLASHLKLNSLLVMFTKKPDYSSSKSSAEDETLADMSIPIPKAIWDMQANRLGVWPRYP